MQAAASAECQACGHLNRAGARFCATCGEPLAEFVSCPHCGASNPGAQKFCDRCGTPLIERVAVPGPDPRSYTPDHLAEKIHTAKGSLEGERKQVTVLFVDVKGSMELLEGLGSEAWRQVMERMFALLCEGVHRFEGTVDQFTGDGIVAFFGAPIAHEDHAQRACGAALYLSDQLARYAEQLKREEGLDLSVRMGLSSGEVVVGVIGEDLQMAYAAIGHSVGLGRRMEELAEPGKAYLTERTAALVSGYFELHDKGVFEIKGVHQPLRVYELAGTGAARTSLEVAGARGFTRLVGRESELASLGAALDRALAGKGQVLGIVSEPGLGKSRLCYELVQRCSERGITVYECRCVPHGARIPWLLVLELLRGYFGVAEHDTEEVVRDKVAVKVLRFDEALKDALPLLFDFLGARDPGRAPSPMDPEARQRQIFATIRRLMRARSRREGAALILMEDLQWLDGSSAAFVENMVEALPGTRTLLLVNFRPEFHATWMQKSYYQQLPLLPLPEEASEELLQDLLGEDHSLDGLSELIVERTGGNPFFIEEVVKELVDNASLVGHKGAYRLARSVDEVTVPPTVQAVLGARIDRLSAREKAVLQSAAVIGRQFPESVVRHATGLSEDELEDALRALIAAEFLYEASPYPQLEYAFTHPLTQEVAHRSQLGRQRARVHGRVAEAIAELYPHKLDEQAALLAYHSEGADDILAAAKWSARAAAWSGLNDPAESARHWNKVRALVNRLPESAETTTLGLTACIWLLRLGWRLGGPEEEAAPIFAEGKALAERTEDLRSLAMLTVAYAATRGLTGHVEDWAKLGFEALRLAERTGDRGLQLAVRPPPSYALFVLGRLPQALATIDRGLELADGDVRLGANTLFVNPYAWSVMSRSFVLGYLGRLAEASEGLHRAMQLARSQGDVEVLGYAHVNRAWLARQTGDVESALAPAGEAVDIAERMGNAYARVQAYSCLAQAHLLREEWDAAAVAGERSLAISRGHGTGLQFEPWTLATLAEARLARGDVPAAGAAAKEAVALARERKTKIFEPITLLALARVLLGSEGSRARTDVEAALSRALSLSAEMGARSEEPLVRVELAKLARLTGDEATRQRELREAHRLFGEIGAEGHAARLAPEISALPSGRPA